MDLSEREESNGALIVAWLHALEEMAPPKMTLQLPPCVTLLAPNLARFGRSDAWH
jgi:hypothetical protein